MVNFRFGLETEGLKKVWVGAEASVWKMRENIKLEKRDVRYGTMGEQLNQGLCPVRDEW